MAGCKDHPGVYDVDCNACMGQLVDVQAAPPPPEVLAGALRDYTPESGRLLGATVVGDPSTAEADARRIGRAVRERLAPMAGPDAYRDPAPADETHECRSDTHPGIVVRWREMEWQGEPGCRLCRLEGAALEAHARGVAEERERMARVLESEETVEAMAIRAHGRLMTEEPDACDWDDLDEEDKESCRVPMRAALAALRERLK